MASPKFLDTTKMSVSFSNRCPRGSAIEPFDDTLGPRKPMVGRVVRNPRRQLTRESMERMGMVEPMEHWGCSTSSADFVRSHRIPSNVSEQERQSLVDERAGFLIEQFEQDGVNDTRVERLADGSLVVRTIVPRHEKKPRSPTKNVANTGPQLFVGEVFDPYLLKAALKAAFGQRLIDLFREWDEDSSGQIERAEFMEAIRAELPLKKWFGFPTAGDKEIMRVFKYFDRDGSGSLDLLELDHLIRKVPNVRPRPGEEVELPPATPSPPKVSKPRGLSNSSSSPIPRASIRSSSRPSSPRVPRSPRSPSPPPLVGPAGTPPIVIPPPVLSELSMTTESPPTAPACAPATEAMSERTRASIVEDPILKIKQLKELLDMGALTEELFERKRDELLARI